jgi:CubicO group peptidase (beta-lactamase class C family)
MRIGSTAKHFTVLAALLLAEEGKLDLDAPATRYIPELPNADVPTLRQFMSHTSGYRCSLELSSVANGQAYAQKGWQLAALARQQGRNFKPGYSQLYCNGGYHLLSIAIDRVAGMPFEAFLKARILTPLGMHDTDGIPSDHKFTPGLATLHVPDPDGGWRRGSFACEEIRGEGNMISTIDDMLRWLDHLNGPKVVGSAETWRQMLEPATLANGFLSVYGLGLYRHKYRSAEVVQHSGSVVGGNSQMITVPAHGLNIAIMINGALVSAQDLSLKIVDVVLGDAVLGDRAPEIVKAERFKSLFAARYASASGMIVGFSPVGDHLGIAYLGYEPAPVLRDEGEVLRVGFEHAALGPVSFNVRELTALPVAPETITYTDAGNEELLRKLPDKPPLPREVAAPLVGGYISHDLAATATIALEGEDLILRLRGDYSGERRFQVLPYSTEHFGLREVEPPNSCLSLSVMTQSNGRVGTFQVNSLRARHLQFRRA